MVIAKCAQTDLPKNQRKPVTDAVRVLYDRIVEGQGSSTDASKKQNQAGKLGDFCKGLKESLDKAYKPDWHVMCGNSLGFACKNRKQSVGVWYIIPDAKDGKDGKDAKEAKGANRLMVVIWKSPGLELELTDAEKEAAKASAAGGDGAAPTAKEAKAAESLHVLHPPPAETDEGSEAETAIRVLREVTLQNATASSVDLSKLIRLRLTMELGTIWHVIVGPDFVIETAESRFNYISATFGKGTRIVCFQHDQKEKSRVDWPTLFRALPWLMVVVAGFAYMTFMSLCESKDPFTAPQSGVSRFLHDKVCNRKDWETELGLMVGLTLFVSFVGKKILKDG